MKTNKRLIFGYLLFFSLIGMIVPLSVSGQSDTVFFDRETAVKTALENNPGVQIALLEKFAPRPKKTKHGAIFYPL
ncbi:MAG: hypothetical protein ACOCUQ_03530 [Bacteroidota bacterium]